MTVKTKTHTDTATIALAETWVEAKKDETAANKVLEAAKTRRKNAALALGIIGATDGDAITVFGNRRMTFSHSQRTNYGFKGALDAVRPLLTAQQDKVVEANLDANKTVSFVTALK